MFSKNEGLTDRTIRVVAGFVLIAVGLFALGGLEASVAGITVAAFGGWFVATGAIGRCPLYVPFGISTSRTRHGPFGIRLRTAHGPAARSSESEVRLRQSRQGALR